MNLFKRKRFIFWLLRAYVKKWGKLFLAVFAVTLLILALLFFNRKLILSKIPSTSNSSVGIAGIYSTNDIPNNLPDVILQNASRGLTMIGKNGEVLPDLAEKWDIKDDGKTFVFYLKPNVTFSDGKPFDSSSVNYNFEDVTIERPAKSVVVFKLKNKYSPFLVTLANQKIFKKNYVGISNYKIKKIKADAGFIDSIDFYSKKDNKAIKYDFYDTQEALKSAYVLGEVSKIFDINNLDYKKRANLASFKNTNTEKEINENKLVTIFLNNQDPLLSDKKVRKALAYALPEKYKEGQRNATPYYPEFWANNKDEKYPMDLENAKEMLKDSGSSESGKITIVLKTLPPYRALAEEIASYWKKIGVETKIETTPGVPTPYQAFLGEFPVLKDPDQYTLWHTGQPGNITNYKNLRIDKLLEDGRQTYKQEDRKKIYFDFQKYLVDDMPAIFLFFPYTYNVSRK